MNKKFTIRQVTWREAEIQLRPIREQVFMKEQQVPEALEWDGEDDQAIHALAQDVKENPIGCARMLSDGHIGRMAVLKSWRGQGVGTTLLNTMLDIAQQQGYPAVELDAQVHAIPFYLRFGFKVCGDEFMDAGIPHRKMHLNFSET